MPPCRSFRSQRLPPVAPTGMPTRIPPSAPHTGWFAYSPRSPIKVLDTLPQPTGPSTRQKPSREVFFRAPERRPPPNGRTPFFTRLTRDHCGSSNKIVSKWPLCVTQPILPPLVCPSFSHSGSINPGQDWSGKLPTILSASLFFFALLEIACW